MTKNTALLLILLAALLSCCAVSSVCGAGFYIYRSLEETGLLEMLTPTAVVIADTPTPSGPTATPFPSPTPAPGATPIAPLPDTETMLREAQIPPNDPIDLAQRLRPELGAVQRVVNANPPSYNVGDILPFWVSNSDTDDNWQIDAELVVKGEHVYMWREVGSKVKTKDLRKAAEFFDDKIYPTNHEFFGSEWSPGIDNDLRLHVLHAKGLGSSIAGYYSSADEIPAIIHPYSNEKEMFYINVDNNKPGSDFYNGTLAHEFQHMIHWYQDKNETTWMNEGFSELASELNGLGRTSGTRPDVIFSGEPDTQLNTWPDSIDTYIHYGNSYLFVRYFLSRFGEKATQALVANDLNGIEAVDDTLQQLQLGLSAEDFFADWVVANWMDSQGCKDERWSYPDYQVEEMATAVDFNALPASDTGIVHQYATDYITFPESDTLTITFEGAKTTQLAATNAHSGDWAWWSNRVDESDTRLTFPVDLSQTDAATLHFFTWYDIEALWDYAYLEVSEDGGKSWKMLETERTTLENPNGNAYGPGYTDKSAGSHAAWVEEQVDLSSYAGQNILLRFEYVTDAAVTQPGMFIDSVSIPEIGYFQDFEQGAGDWQTEGWLLTNNILHQNWLVQVIEPLPHGQVRVHRVPVDADGHGELHLTGIESKDDLILAISALAPATVESASYQFEISP